MRKAFIQDALRSNALSYEELQHYSQLLEFPLSIEKPIQKPIEDPIEKSIDPIEKSIDPIEKPIEATLEEPLCP